jgi:hypothetical protein
MKHLLFSVLKGSGALALARTLRRRSLVVITYHGVLPTADDRDHFLCGNFVACSAFEWQMARVRRYYTPVSLSQVVRALENGEPLPERALAVTFDDGFANNYRFAGPILRTYGIPATVFLATGHLDVPGAQLWTERVKRAVFLSTLERLPAVLPELAELPLGSDGQRADSARKVLGRMKRMPPADRDRALAELERVCGRPPLLEGDRDRYDFLTWEEVRRTRPVSSSARTPCPIRSCRRWTRPHWRSRSATRGAPSRTRCRSPASRSPTRTAGRETSAPASSGPWTGRAIAPRSSCSAG